jgi:hypothetical protein
MPAANPITAIETSAHRRTRSYDIDWFRACAAFASFAENALAAFEGNQAGERNYRDMRAGMNCN